MAMKNIVFKGIDVQMGFMPMNKLSERDEKAELSYNILSDLINSLKLQAALLQNPIVTSIQVPLGILLATPQEIERELGFLECENAPA
jgi:hypothetical protein